jgi:kinesin family member 20
MVPPAVSLAVSARPPLATLPSRQVLTLHSSTDPQDHRLHASNSSFFSGTLIRSSELPAALNLNPLSHPSHPDSTTTTPTAVAPPSIGTIYKFTEVFGLPPASSPFSDSNSAPIADPSANSQSAFFTRTTLPLVHDFLSKGENCLLFAFGTTGSGKTWTVQGGKGGEEEVGILPRVLDVVWRSLEGKGGAEVSLVFVCLRDEISMTYRRPN